MCDSSLHVSICITNNLHCVSKEWYYLGVHDIVRHF